MEDLFTSSVTGLIAIHPNAAIPSIIVRAKIIIDLSFTQR